MIYLYIFSVQSVKDSGSGDYVTIHITPEKLFRSVVIQILSKKGK